MSRFRFDSHKPRAVASGRTVARPEVVTVEKLAAGGAGFARREGGEPLFIRGALPGDTISVQQLRSRKGYAEVLRWDLVEPSPDRRSAPCPYAARCGGCDLMALNPPAQRQVKHAMVVEILRRTAHVDATATSATPLQWQDPERVRAAPADERERIAALGYRSRIRLHIDDQAGIGLLAEQSHVVVPVERCLVATDRVNQVLHALQALAALRPDLLLPFEQVEIRALGEKPDLMWTARHREGKPRPRQAALSATLETIGRHLNSEAPELDVHLTLRDDAHERWREFVQSAALGPADTEARLWFAPGSFTQVNWEVNQTIISKLLKAVQSLGSKTFLDLYCGAGNFSLPLLAIGLQGVGVESNPTAIATATAAAARQGLGGRFLAEDVAIAVERLIVEQARFDVILLDPPRAGFKDVVPKLAKLAPNHLFICACDPVTFARDLRGLREAGFELQRLEAYDMFPQTHHVECAAWLTYRGTSAESEISD